MTEDVPTHVGDYSTLSYDNSFSSSGAPVPGPGPPGPPAAMTVAAAMESPLTEKQQRLMRELMWLERARRQALEHDEDWHQQEALRRRHNIAEFPAYLRKTAAGVRNW